MKQPYLTILSETEIRPDDMRVEQAKHFAIDVARLVSQVENFVEVDCPACRHSEKTPRFQKYGLDYVTCAACETVFISPRPTPAILADFYTHSQNYEFWNSHIFPASENARRIKIFRPRAQRVMELCERYNMKGGVLVEVGAGFGTFCEEMHDLNLFERIIAVEPTPALAETCRQRSVEVVELPFEEVSLDNHSVDVIVAFEVIEHLFDPQDFMGRCHQMLRPDGLLVVTCPNVKGFDIETLGVVSDSVDCEHLNYFHADSLSYLAQQNGFETLETLTPGELDAELVRKKVLDGQFSIQGQPFLERVLLQEWDKVGNAFQQFLAQNRLSSHLWLVARKAE